jgi:CheY-like chemotaxis protein
MWSTDECGPRVLVVDDEEGIRALANRALRSAGYEVVTAADGREGLDVMNSSPAV